MAESRHDQARALTLLEVLVALFIIAVLAAILLPVLSAARGKAQQSACLSHISQLSEAMLMYAEDYDGGLTNWIPRSWWGNQIQPYVGRSRGLSCPSFSVQLLHAGFPHGVEYNGYARNICLQSVQQAPNPSRTVLLTEVAEFVQTYRSGTYGYFYPSALARPDIYEYGPDVGRELGISFQVLRPYGAERHRGGCIYTFMDGHARWYRPIDVRVPSKGPGCNPEPATWQGPEQGPAFWILP